MTFSHRITHYFVEFCCDRRLRTFLKVVQKNLQHTCSKRGGRSKAVWTMLKKTALSAKGGFPNSCTLLERLNYSLCFILWSVGKVYTVVKGFTASATWGSMVTTCQLFGSFPRFQIPLVKVLFVLHFWQRQGYWVSPYIRVTKDLGVSINFTKIVTFFKDRFFRPHCNFTHSVIFTFRQ